MALNRRQLALLHTAPRDLGIDDAQRKMIQRNLGQSWSAGSMSYPGFVACMAHYESLGWRDPQNPSDHWRGLNARSGDLRMQGKAMKLAAVIGWINHVTGYVDFPRLNRFVQRQTEGRRRTLRDCDGEDLARVIEGLKAIQRRGGKEAS